MVCVCVPAGLVCVIHAMTVSRRLLCVDPLLWALCLPVLMCVVLRVVSVCVCVDCRASPMRLQLLMPMTMLVRTHAHTRHMYTHTRTHTQWDTLTPPSVT